MPAVFLQIAVPFHLHCCFAVAGSGDGELRAKSRGVQIAEPPARPDLEPAQPDDVALFLHTSGTTSRPKGGCNVQALVSGFQDALSELGDNTTLPPS